MSAALDSGPSAIVPPPSSPSDSSRSQTLDADHTPNPHPTTTISSGAAEEEEEEEYECGFCLFMKGGGCKDPFVAWENCMEEAKKSGEDPVDRCFDVTSLLKKCMDDHADYYAPILGAEKAMADSVEELKEN